MGMLAGKNTWVEGVCGLTAYPMQTPGAGLMNQVRKR